MREFKILANILPANFQTSYEKEFLLVDFHEKFHRMKDYCRIIVSRILSPVKKAYSNRFFEQKKCKILRWIVMQ